MQRPCRHRLDKFMCPLDDRNARAIEILIEAEIAQFLDVIEAMRRAKVLVVQGRFSSVSEAVARRRPTVVVPITGHAEQHVNARIFENLGLGLAAPRASDAGAKVLEILGDLRRFETQAREHRIATDGAREAVRILLEMIA